MSKETQPELKPVLGVSGELYQILARRTIYRSVVGTERGPLLRTEKKVRLFLDGDRYDIGSYWSFVDGVWHVRCGFAVDGEVGRGGVHKTERAARAELLRLVRRGLEQRAKGRS